MDSFMTWIGGKKALRGKIVEQFPEPGTYGRYIEVFGGAGWVLFSSDSHAKMEVYNDVNGNLVNLFRCIKYHPDAVQNELQYILISREQFYDAREQIEMRGMTDIQRAARCCSPSLYTKDELLYLSEGQAFLSCIICRLVAYT